jgi:phenylalanyl-tRNA synthetase beta chain
VRLPIGWLGVFVALDSLELGQPLRADAPEVQRLVADLDSLGLVVEGVEEHRGPDSGVVTARILAIHPIEGADRIRLVEVDDGSGRVRPVVCGAWNFVEGDVVPLALPGTHLPNGLEIEARKLRGVVSEGMLCSASEAGIGADAGGLALLPRDLAVGVPLAEVFGIGDEVVLDLAIEPNRPDASGVRGVARDLAARRRVPFADLAGSLGDAEERPGAVVLEPGASERFLLAALQVAGAQLDAKVARWLALAGMRSVSPIVDATNAVMIESGQPSHAYDRDRLAGGLVGVRTARPGEQLRTLDGRDRVLEGEELVIVDAEDRPVGLAGMLGGAETEVATSTTQVLLEVAAFPRERIARAARRHGLRTEASWRFERGVDPEVAEAVAVRVAAVVGLPAPQRVLDVAEPSPPRRLVLRRSEVVGRVGDEVVLEAFMSGAGLERLGFAISPSDDGWEVTVPSWRPDVEGVADVVEEALRQVGYDAVTSAPLRGPHRLGPSARQRLERELSALLAGMGAFEAWSVTLVDPGIEARIASGVPAPKLRNPLRPEESVLRSTVLAGLLPALQQARRRQLRPVRLFEWGPVFAEVASGIEERTRLGLLVTHPEDGGKEAARWLAALVARAGRSLGPDAIVREVHAPGWPQLHPARRATVMEAGSVVGVVGELDPALVEDRGVATSERVGYLELDADWLLAPSAPQPLRTPSSHPATELDLSFEVPWELVAWQLASTVRGALGERARHVWVFDEFVREGVRSVGLRVRLEDDDAPVSDAVLAELIERAREVGAALGARLRTAPAVSRDT